MQIGLNVVALDGRVITQLRTFVFRCYACFNITDNMKRAFCQKCGLKTLKRVSVLVDKDGNKYVNVNFKRPLSTKGKRVSSSPAPTQRISVLVFMVAETS